MVEVTYETLTIVRGENVPFVARKTCPRCNRPITLSSNKGMFNSSTFDFGLDTRTHVNMLTATVWCEWCAKRIELTENEMRLFSLPMQDFEEWFAERERESPKYPKADSGASTDAIVKSCATLTNRG